MRKTKIVCTIGPACSSEECVKNLIKAGMNVARLNFSHGTQEEHAERIEMIRSLSASLGQPVGILQDLSGPKIRLGMIAAKCVNLVEGRKFVFTTREVAGSEKEVTLPYPEFVEQVKKGSTIFVDDARLQFRVISKTDTDIVTKVVIGGELSSRKGVSVPGTRLCAAPLTEKDISDLEFGLKHGVDWVAVSFVRTPNDRAAADEVMKRVGIKRPLIAKIERPEAVAAIDEIIDAFDGIMVARGDLGIELAIYDVPIIQKSIIKKCNAAGKPVITATQMLDSMISNPRPTRAEASDVANAILDGTDATMLSGETAAGDYPVESVRMMARIARRAERSISYTEELRERTAMPARSVTEAIGQASAELAADLKVAAVVTCTATGTTARLVSKYRPSSLIVAAVSRPEAVGQLTLSWGVLPLPVPASNSTDDLIYVAVRSARKAGYVRPGDTVVVTAGVPVGVPGNTSLIRVISVE
ncbi:MAG: pyruvate kinase [Armatimonadota bacterium]